MDYILPGSSVHGIFQARVLEWLSFPSPGDLPDAGIEPGSPALQADALPSEPPGIGQRQILYVITYKWKLKSKTNKYNKTEAVSQMQKTNW